MNAILVRDISSSWATPEISAIETSLFNAIGLNLKATRLDVHPLPTDPAPPLQLVKNTACMSDLFFASVCPIVSSRLRDKLAPLVKAEFRRVEFTHPYRYPYVLGSRSYLDDPEYPEREGDPDRIIMRFARRYRCPPPDAEYFEVAAYLHRQVKDRFDDWRRVVIKDAPHRVSIDGLMVSEQMIIEYGMQEGFGLLCREDVYRIIEPHLVRPYFWTRAIPLSGDRNNNSIT